MPGASAAVSLKQTQGQLGADELLEIEIGGNRKGIDVELEVVIDALLAVEALHDQGFRQTGFLRAVQRDQARVLRQAGAEERRGEARKECGRKARCNGRAVLPAGRCCILGHGIASS